jgi:hypothetical protein
VTKKLSHQNKNPNKNHFIQTHPFYLFLPIARPTTPKTLENHAQGTEYTTPIRSRIQAIIEFNSAYGIPFFKTDVFRYFGVEPRTGYRILKGESRRLHQQEGPNPRERKPIIIRDQLRKIEDILEQGGIETRSLT